MEDQLTEKQFVKHKKAARQTKKHNPAWGKAGKYGPAKEQLELRKLKKRDKMILILLLLLAAGMLAWFWFGHQEGGAMVEITVDGEPFGTYPLNEEQEILIKGGNRLLIADGKADMIWADCPDKLCVHQMAISHVGESIVCLPNQVVAAIVGPKEAQSEQGLDTVAQ